MKPSESALLIGFVCYANSNPSKSPFVELLWIVMGLAWLFASFVRMRSEINNP